MSTPSRDAAAALDGDDPLAPFVERFVADDAGLVYLDGNSLGRLPIATRDRLADAVSRAWGGDLVRGWQQWIDLPTGVGDRLASLIGARPGEVVVCDSTTVNLFKVVVAGLTARPDRRVVLIPADEFPTDRYVVDGVAAQLGRTVRHGDPSDVDGDVALVVASAVDYRTGRRADIAGTTAAVHEAGALVCWDLSHAIGSVEVDLTASDADLAVGCTYKHVCAGPGAPAFLYARRELQPELASPIWGWFAQRDQFAMGPAHDPEPGIRRFLTGTPNVFGLLAVDEGVRLVAEAGVERLQHKATTLTRLVITLADAWLEPLGFQVASPRVDDERGAHVALAHPDAYRIARALLDRDVVVDVRPPDLLRVGPAPISTRHTDVWDGLDRLRTLVATGAHLEYSDERGRVT